MLLSDDDPELLFSEPDGELQVTPEYSKPGTQFGGLASAAQPLFFPAKCHICMHASLPYLVDVAASAHLPYLVDVAASAHLPYLVDVATSALLHTSAVLAVPTVH